MQCNENERDVILCSDTYYYSKYQTTQELISVRLNGCRRKDGAPRNAESSMSSRLPLKNNRKAQFLASFRIQLLSIALLSPKMVY